MSNDVPLLTAKQSYYEVEALTYEANAALIAITQERAVVVPRMSEAEARERFDKWADPNIGRVENRIEWRAYLAALRDIGCLKD